MEKRIEQVIDYVCYKIMEKERNREIIDLSLALTKLVMAKAKLDTAYTSKADVNYIFNRIEETLREEILKN